MSLSATTTFTELAATFNWHANTLALVEGKGPNQLGCLSLEYFTGLAASEEKKDQIAKLIPDIPEVVQLVQASRLRQAWSAIRKFKSEADAVKRKLDESAEDLDALLPAKELEGIADRFWARYHLSYAPDLDPSEGGLSRLSK